MDIVPPDQRLNAPPPGASLVYFMRPQDGSGAIRALLLDDEYFVGQLVENAHLAYVTKPGRHLFSVASNTMEFWETELEPGKTYYVTVRRRVPRQPFVFIEHTTPEEIAEIRQGIRVTKAMRPNEYGLRWIESRRTNLRWMRSKWYGKWQASRAQEVAAAE
ncbi:MAG TPA: hypothetical protein VEC57_18410 [Candidatus Limnocylindrales bacterium]|nr:hypothetical protein [Candidatus Limnocylindrales bacterium]